MGTLADDEDLEAEIGAGPAHEVALTASLARAEASGHAAAPEEALISAETEKLALETRHLSLRYFNERLSAALKVLAIALGVVVLAGLGAMAWTASQDHALVIEPFSAPASFSQRGVTGDVLAADVMERLASMTRLVNAQSFRTSSDVAGDDVDQVKVEIPETGVSIGELWRGLRDWLGHERRVTGSLRETPDGRVEIVARIAGHDPVSATGAPGDLDQLETSLAEKLFQADDPVNWVTYLDGAGRHSEAMAAAQAFAATATGRAARANAFALWGDETNDPTQAVELTDIALRIDPDLSLVYFVRMRALEALGRDEARLANARRGLLAYDPNLRSLVQGRGASVVRAYFRQHIDELTGDFVAEERDESQVYEDPSHLSLRQARYAAWRHDGAFARSLLAEGVDPGAGPPLSVAISRYEVDAEMDNWTAASVDAASMISAEEASRAKAATPDEAIGAAVAEATAYRPRLAEAKLQLGDLAGADAAIAATPLDCYRCLRERGRIAAAHGDAAGAARWFAEASRQGPSIPFAYVDWAQLLLARGDAAGAIGKLQLAAAAGPRFADVQELWGEALMRQGDFEGADARFSAANTNAPQWGRNHLLWGEALAQLGRRDDAVAQWRTAQGLDLSASDRAKLARDLAGRSSAK